MQAGALSGTHAGNLGDIHADRHGILLAHFLGDIADGDAQHDLTALGLILDGIRVVNHLRDEILDVVDRDGVADALDAHGRALGVDDADDVAVGIKQRAAGVAGVDGRIRLNGVDGHVVDGQLLLDGGDDARGHRAVHLTHRVADGHGQLADLKLIAVAEGRGIQAGRVDLEHRDVVALGGTDERGLVALLFAAVAGVDVDGDLVRAGDDVVVGQNVAVLRDDDAGTGGLLGVFLRAAAAAAVAVAIAEAVAEHAAERVVIVVVVGVIDHLGLRLDGHDGGAALLGDLRDGEGILIRGGLDYAEMFFVVIGLSQRAHAGRNRQRQRGGQGNQGTNGFTHKNDLLSGLNRGWSRRKGRCFPARFPSGDGCIIGKAYEEKMVDLRKKH